MISELSILIPVYNDNALPLVSELQRQAAVISGLEYEILAVDDGSTDACIILENEAIDIIEHCKYVRCPHSGCRAAMRNNMARYGKYEWGLMVDVAPPDFETRLAIIKNKAALLGVQLPDDISSFIAENLTANVRQIEGALNKLLAYRDLLGNQVDGEAVSRAVKDMLKKYNEFVPSPSLIIEYICRYYDVDEEQVRGQGRKRDLMEARQTAMYLIRRMTNLSLNDIGKEFGDRDHTTVLHSLDQVEKKMRSDPAYAEKVKEITTNINNKK